MSYEQHFIDECLRNEKIRRLVKDSHLHIDREGSIISFGATVSKITILPFSVDASTDGELRIQFDNYRALFLLDGIAHYGDSKKITQTVEIFADLVASFFERGAFVERFTLWGLSRVRVATSMRTYVSMPFDRHVVMRELGQLLPIISCGRRSKLTE